ncbi:MAG: hypothetical protein WCA91_13305 [Candidatus Acidiferrales bacterium]
MLWKGPTTTARNRSAVGVILTLALALAFGKSGMAGQSQPPVDEPSPQVRSAVDGVLDLFRQKSVVALGDFHGMAQEEAFFGALIRDPRFADRVGNVVVEFGGKSAQNVIDRFANGEDVPFAELRHIWTDVVGWVPGPFYLGYVNFFAVVRAANLRLPANKRIRVWLGEPEIDWTKIHSHQDLLPYLERREDNVFRIIGEEILQKQKKTLLIIGAGHLFNGPDGHGSLRAKIDSAYPNDLAVVTPVSWYVESACNAKFVSRAKDWPVPAVAGPVEGWLKAELQLPGCDYFTAEQVEQIKKMAVVGASPGGAGPKTPRSPAEIIASSVTQVSGVTADAILYFGPPDTLTRSPIEPSIYLDPEYFAEMNRRAQCCFLPPNNKPLDWDQILQRNPVVPKEYLSDMR